MIVKDIVDSDTVHYNECGMDRYSPAYLNPSMRTFHSYCGEIVLHCFPCRRSMLVQPEIDCLGIGCEERHEYGGVQIPTISPHSNL